MERYQVSFYSDFSEADRYAVILTNRLQSYYGSKMNPKVSFHINFVLRELLNNAVEHGNAFDRNKKVMCSICCDNQMVIICVRDEGAGFSLDMTAAPETNGANQQRSRGLWMIQQLGLTLNIKGNQVKAIYYWRVSR
ncbi:ATP-binding protein [Anoxynatronum sibiricum]|uniref:ATP-binding protein n=1 Tax=Anoxynatronum sibiricum TaxID=210623 RepID=A0ABU9VQE1_9CLOT